MADLVASSYLASLDREKVIQKSSSLRPRSYLQSGQFVYRQNASPQEMIQPDPTESLNCCLEGVSLQEQNTYANGQDRQRCANFQVFEKGNLHMPARPFNHNQICDGAEQREISSQS